MKNNECKPCLESCLKEIESGLGYSQKSLLERKAKLVKDLKEVGKESAKRNPKREIINDIGKMISDVFYNDEIVESDTMDKIFDENGIYEKIEEVDNEGEPWDIYGVITETLEGKDMKYLIDVYNIIYDLTMVNIPTDRNLLIDTILEKQYKHYYADMQPNSGYTRKDLEKKSTEHLECLYQFVHKETEEGLGVGRKKY